jgi:hypothetical protein
MALQFGLGRLSAKDLRGKGFPLDRLRPQALFMHHGHQLVASG